MAGAHSPRHIGERLGHDDHDPVARGHSGRCDEPKQGRTSVDPPLGHDEHPCQRGHPGRHEGDVPSRRTLLHPAAQHAALAALRSGSLSAASKSYIQSQETTTLARSVFDGSFPPCPNRQSQAPRQ